MDRGQRTREGERTTAENNIIRTKRQEIEDRGQKGRGGLAEKVTKER
jgi:hypothetical protein